MPNTSSPARFLTVLAACFLAGCATAADSSAGPTFHDAGGDVDLSTEVGDDASVTPETAVPGDDASVGADTASGSDAAVGADTGGTESAAGCTPHCSTDNDCLSTCAPISTGNNCCDLATNSCYVSASACAPVTYDGGVGD